MKISKLFHWLYAFLMLLPVFFIGGRCLYVTFNKNAKDSYYGETINQKQYVEKKINQFNVNDYVYYNNNNQVLIQRDGNDLIISAENIVLNDVQYNNADTIRFYAYPNSPNSTALWLVVAEGTNTLISRNVLSDTYQLYFNFLSYNQNVQVDYINDLVFYDIQYNQYSYLDNAFIYSVNSINDTPLFSWAKTSFLVAPFSYISGLFGIESTNPINTMLSYWLAISIIWLVFDLIMYVPLLVHRWIDKAKLE